MKVAVINRDHLADLTPVTNGDLTVRNRGKVIIKDIGLPNNDFCVGVPGLEKNFSRAQTWSQTETKGVAISNNQSSFASSTHGHIKADKLANNHLSVPPFFQPEKTIQIPFTRAKATELSQYFKRHIHVGIPFTATFVASTICEVPSLWRCGPMGRLKTVFANCSARGRDH